MPSNSQRTLIVWTLCLSVWTSPGWAVEPLKFGNRKQLLVDDFVIARREKLKRVLHPAKKENGGKPIFTSGRFYGTVLHDGGKFKLWWRKHAHVGYGYAESKDGLKFTKIADVSGINFAGDFTLSVTIDQNEKDPLHRYKAAYDAPGMSAGIAHSADGIRWTPYNKGKPVTHRAADTYNQILWDPEAKLYRLFTRSDFGTAGGDGEVRGHRVMVNPDPKSNPTNWKTIRSWIFDREGKAEIKRRQIYALTDWMHHGVHFGLMSVYEWPGDVSEGPFDAQRRHERDVMNFYIGTSRNAKDWDLQWVYSSQPMIRRGGKGAFDKDLLTAASSIVTFKDRHWLYYGGANERHGTPKVPFNRTHAIAVATLRLDGFISLTAGRSAGTLVTKPFLMIGRQLQLNIEAPRGSVQVELLDKSGQPLAGYSGQDAARLANVDSVRQPVHFTKSLADQRGKIARLRIKMTNAHLYAFQVKK